MAILKPNSARAAAPMKQDTGRLGRPVLPSQIAPAVTRPQPTAPARTPPGALPPGVGFTGPNPVSSPIGRPVPAQMQPPQMGQMPGLGRPAMMPQPAPQPQQPGEMVPKQPPTFNLPSPVPVLNQTQPPAANLNTTPGQLGNQVPPPAPGMTGAAPLGSAPASIGADSGYQQFLQTNPDFVNQYGAGDMNQAYDFYTQQMAQAQAAGPMGMASPGGGGFNVFDMGGHPLVQGQPSGIMALPGMGAQMMPGMMPQTQY